MTVNESFIRSWWILHSIIFLFRLNKEIYTTDDIHQNTQSLRGGNWMFDTVVTHPHGVYDPDMNFVVYHKVLYSRK